MYKRIKYFFTNNLYWKALSVLMAVALWFVVMNINNPTEIKTFTLNIDILNEDKLEKNNLAILNIDDLKNQRADIKIKGTRTTLDEISKRYNKENIKLQLDLEQVTSYKIGDEPLEVIANLRPSITNIPYPNNSFEIVSFYPITSTLYVDKVITIPKKIHPKTIGETKQGYTASDPNLSSEYIQVTGAKSIVDKIQVIYAEVDITDQTSTIKRNVVPVAYDENGNKITDIKFNIQNVDVKVPISIEGVVNIVEPALIGNLLEGYIVDSVSYSPKSVEVIGDKANLRKLTKIILPEINITGLTNDTQYTYDISQILKQHNLKLKNSKDSEVEIDINIKQATTKFITVPTSNISILGYNDKLFIDIPEEFTINITGEDNLINNINTDLIHYNIDVTGLDVGEHSVKVNVDLPNDIRLASDTYIDVKISEKEENISTQQETTQSSETKIEEQKIIQETVQIENTSQTEDTTNKK
ncbi:CdaR family protein [uncultured Tyzzerella sp.]|uniref:CdaR family protein n=1 Tax=uncultured Tyzzerella sp. TaxID=2321398 RepID=UPI0029423C6B|nr:CdaR family protein [uncultured Tyzzerella sp.]